jgi:hypothetical protein
VDPLDIDECRKRMNPATRHRFDECWDYLFSETLFLACDEERVPSRLTPQDASLLRVNGICSPVSAEDAKTDPTRGLCIPFTVLQEKHADESSTMQRRFILWTRAHNFWCRQNSYDPMLPDLEHVSAFLPDIKHPAATLRDMRLSFWQVEIPIWARAMYRFRDTDGTLYEMLRLPMGHTVSPEIMQTLASVLAGDPEYCAEEYSLAVPARTVWIDNIRLCGGHKEMQEAAE